MVQAKFWEKLRLVGECWEYAGTLTYDGYGSGQPHRKILQMRGVEVPPGMEVDHTCFNRRCCNPAHLEIVTPSENRRRSWARRKSLPGYRHPLSKTP